MIRKNASTCIVSFEQINKREFYVAFQHCDAGFGHSNDQLNLRVEKWEFDFFAYRVIQVSSAILLDTILMTPLYAWLLDVVF